MLGIKTPLIISDRSNPYLEKKINLKYKTFLYPFSDALVLQTKGVQSYYSNIKKINIHTIPNPVREFTYKGEEPFSSKTICSVGRLINSIKGFDLLIEAFSLISDKYKDYNLIIYGEGRDRKKLEQLVQRKNLSDRIFLPGKIKNPQQKIAHANMFVLSSLQEGFPNVLLEAMSTGLPVISFNCNYGPSEIIDNNVNGLLVEAGNVAKLSSAMEKLIQNEKLCNTIGVNAQQKVMDHFYIEKVMAKWESLINEVIQ
ncbi:MAG TPA: glycosyltransferase family 4 protein [Flavobacteriia bacterium]|nr:glycosyltransferase family 4 protein [Flavobacteriia bacterium]